MTTRPRVGKLPEFERRQMLHAFLDVLHRHVDLTHFRLLVRSAADRQLALFAALERATCIGAPIAFPPRPGDHADALLCDVLDALDLDPSTSNHGAFYGPDRHLVNLQALGLWIGEKPLSLPTARELFTTRFYELTAMPGNDLASPGANKSPLLQDSPPGGDLIAAQNNIAASAGASSQSSQVLDIVLLPRRNYNSAGPDELAKSGRLIHHDAHQPGEKNTDAPADLSNTTEFVPARPVRRGRPFLIDERAKGRILGLMAYGLSLRQAAAQLSIHHTTLLAAMKRDEEFAEQVSEARLDAISQPLLTVIQASRRSWRAAAWLAKFLDDRRRNSLEPTPSDTNQAASNPLR